MQLISFSVVFVVLLGRICFSKILFKTHKSDGYAELEDATTFFLSNCYGDKDKTMVLTADIPETFIKKLSSQQSHSIVLLENRQPIATADRNFWKGTYTLHKVHILVAMAPSHQSLYKVFDKFSESKYASSMVSVLLIGWSPEKKYGPCNYNVNIREVLFVAKQFRRPDVNIICRDVNKGIVIYTFNPLTNYAPKPWRFVETKKLPWYPFDFTHFIREYRKHEEMCENLFFEKWRDMHGSPVKVTRECNTVPCQRQTPKNDLVQVDTGYSNDFIDHFLRYVNATEETMWVNEVAGDNGFKSSILATSVAMREACRTETCTYPHGEGCSFILTQYRGNKSQTQKIYDVLDGYSWIGLIVVCFITVIFFKYFLRQPLIVGILNLWRLTCSLGLPKLPPNVPPRIYLGCLFFFMLTMQGIFTSSLASVMTHNVPVRQVNTIQDLIDFGYTVYAFETDFRVFTDLALKGRLIKISSQRDCLKDVERDHLVACYKFSGHFVKTYYATTKTELYVSKDCTETEELITILPRIWPLYEILHKFLAIKKAGDFLTSFEVLVRSKRLLEKEVEEKIVEPKVMILTDLVFAFVILGIGLACALVSFIMEVLIPIYQKKLRHHPKFSWIRRCVR